MVNSHSVAPQRAPVRSTPLRIAPYAALLVAVLLIGGLFQTSPGRGLLHGAGLLARPTSYTELAFTDPRTLPTELIPSQDATGIQFAVHNATPSTRVYRWTASVTKLPSSAAAGPAAATGTIRLAPGARTTVAFVLRSVRCTPGPVAVSISLSGSNETIRYQATCTNSSGGTSGGQVG